MSGSGTKRLYFSGILGPIPLLLARLGLWLRRQRCKMYVGTCPLCDPQKQRQEAR